MKLLLSFNFLFLLFFCSFNTTYEYCPPEEEVTVTTVTQICQFPNLSFGDPGVCLPNSVELVIDDNCNAVGKAVVRVVNLEDNPVIGQDYYLPFGVPSVYYQYQALGQDEKIGPINKFTFKGEYHGTFPIFEFNADMNIDVSQVCVGGELVSVPITVTLREKSGELYPIDNHAGVNEPFYCGVFAETCDECSSPPATCAGGSLPVYNINSCGECGGCNNRSISNDEDLKPITAKPEAINLGEVNNEVFFGVAIQPNPFNDRLMINYSSEKASEVKIEIIDFNGKSIHQEKTFQTQGGGSLEINTAHLPNGIYFCRVKFDTQVFVEKIIKI